MKLYSNMRAQARAEVSAKLIRHDPPNCLGQVMDEGLRRRRLAGQFQTLSSSNARP